MKHAKSKTKQTERRLLSCEDTTVPCHQRHTQKQNINKRSLSISYVLEYQMRALEFFSSEKERENNNINSKKLNKL